MTILNAFLGKLFRQAQTFPYLFYVEAKRLREGKQGPLRPVQLCSLRKSLVRGRGFGMKMDMRGRTGTRGPKRPRHQVAGTDASRRRAGCKKATAFAPKELQASLRSNEGYKTWGESLQAQHVRYKS